MAAVPPRPRAGHRVRPPPGAPRQGGRAPARHRRGRRGRRRAPERGPAAKKQVFARALKRVNARLDGMAAEARRAAALARRRATLARVRAAPVHHPDGGATARGAMRAKAAGRRPRIVQGGRIGSTSQAGRAAQAGRDARG